MWAKVFGNAVGGDEASEGSGLGFRAGRAEDFVGQVEGQFLAVLIREQVRHLFRFPLFDGISRSGKELGRELAGAINQVRRGNPGCQLLEGR